MVGRTLLRLFVDVEVREEIQYYTFNAFAVSCFTNLYFVFKFANYSAFKKLI